MACTGDAAETCGGVDAMTVYEITGGGSTSDGSDDATSGDTAEVNACCIVGRLSA